MGLHIPLEERLHVDGSYSGLAMLAGYTFITVSAAFKPSLTRTLTTGAVLIATTFIFSRLDFDVPYLEIYGILTSWGCQCFAWLDRVVLANQDGENWHVIAPTKDADGKLVKAKVTPPDRFLPRLSWSWSQTVAPRGVARSWQVKKVPTSPSLTAGRWTFFAKSLLRGICFLIVCDVSKIYCANTPMCQYRYWDDAVNSTQVYPLNIYHRIIGSWLAICQTYWTISFGSSFIYAFTVLLGLWRHEECPPAFGSLYDLYSLRNAWSVVWHQLLRRTATFSSTLVVRRWLKLRPGSFASKYAQLAIGFAAPAAAHSYASILLFGRDKGEMMFWLSQVFAILFEDEIIAYGKSLGYGDNRLWRAIGAIWVFVWLSWSTQMYVGIQVEEGAFIGRRPPNWFGLDTWMKSRQLLS